MMKTWLISNYSGPSRIVGDIINNLAKRGKPAFNNRKEKFSFYSAITGAIQRLLRLLRVTHINGAQLESCLLSRSTLSSLINLLPIAEYDCWVRELCGWTGLQKSCWSGNFICFKQVCIIERNENESSGDYPDAREVITSNTKSVGKTNLSVQNQEEEESEQGSSV